MNKKPIIILLVMSAAVLSYFIAVAAIPHRSVLVEQPIIFNHKRHQEKDVACYDCHQFYNKYAVAGIPGTELCYSCHQSDKDLLENKEKEKLHNYFSAKREIIWNRINTPLPDDLIFNHKSHVAKDCKCADCHGAIEELVETKRLVQDFTMDKCLECHNKEQASTDCLTCHK